MTAFIDEHRGAYGVEPICKVMQIAPSSYWLHAQRRDRPELRPARAQRDEQLVSRIEQVWQANLLATGRLRSLFRSTSAVDYYDGERTGPPSE